MRFKVDDFCASFILFWRDNECSHHRDLPPCKENVKLGGGGRHCTHVLCACECSFSFVTSSIVPEGLTIAVLMVKSGRNLLDSNKKSWNARAVGASLEERPRNSLTCHLFQSSQLCYPLSNISKMAVQFSQYFSV